jgi:drug/metabolite transporter (DMT)-like permease
MAGLLLVNGGGDGFRLGVGFWLLCATLPLIGLGDVLSKRLTRDLSPLVLSVGRSVYGALFLLLVTPFLGLAWIDGAVEWLALAAAGLLQGVGVWTLYRAMQGGKASLVAAMVAAAPLATLAAESAFLGLHLAVLQWIGLVIVLGAATWLVVGQGRR